MSTAAPVIPAKAGIQFSVVRVAKNQNWAPACAGATI